MTGRLMVDRLAKMFRRETSGESHGEALSPEDRKRLREAAARARQRLQEAGMLDVERDAQREIRARVHAA